MEEVPIYRSKLSQSSYEQKIVLRLQKRFSAHWRIWGLVVKYKK